MRRAYRAAVLVAAAAVAVGGCSDPADNSKIQTPNDKAIGAPSKPGQAPAGPGGQHKAAGRTAPLK